MRTGRGILAELAKAVGEAGGERCYFFPIFTRARVVAVLYADAEGGTVEAGVLELLANVAGAVLEGQHAGRKAQGLHSIAGQGESD